MRQFLVLTVAALLLATATPAEAATSGAARYIASSANIDFVGTPATAAGLVDCNGVTGGATGANLGGACFDLTGVPLDGSASLVIQAQDDLGFVVSLFAGFDLNGDRCVGCTKGLGGDDIAAETNAGQLLLPVPIGGVPDNTLRVFIRLLNSDGTATNAASIGTVGFFTVVQGAFGFVRFEDGQPNPEQPFFPQECPRKGNETGGVSISITVNGATPFAGDTDCSGDPFGQGEGQEQQNTPYPYGG